MRELELELELSEEEGDGAGASGRLSKELRQTRKLLQGPLVQFDVNNHGSGASIYEVYDRASHELCSRDVGVDRVPRFDPKAVSCLPSRYSRSFVSHSLLILFPSTKAAPSG